MENGTSTRSRSKRKRGHAGHQPGIDVRVGRSSGSNQKTHNVAISKKRLKNIPEREKASAIPKTSQPLKGKIVAVSTLHDAAYNYKSVSALCSDQLGAKIAAQVHKKVFCVVASHEAAGRGQSPPTQRVRKAWKSGIPVMSIDWVHQCREARKLLPFDGDQHRFLEPTDSPENPSGTSNKHRATDANVSTTNTASSETTTAKIADNLLEEKRLDLGCCCVCHETGITDCEWCVDCNVNRSAAGRQAPSVG